MDFKYIEQLLQRYLAAETTLQEERILCEFFRQEDVPPHLLSWRLMFDARQALADARLDRGFDERLLRQTGEVHVRARRITLAARLRPFYKVAACAALVAAVGIALERPLAGRDGGTDVVAEGSMDELDPSGATPLDIRSAEVSAQEMPGLASSFLRADSASLPTQ